MVALLHTELATTKPQRHREATRDLAGGQNNARSTRQANRSLDDDNRRRTFQTHYLLRAQRLSADSPILSSSTRNGSWRYGSYGTGHLLVKRSRKQLLGTNLKRPIGSPFATSVQN